MRWLAVWIVGLVTLTQPTEAQACSCMELSPSEGLSSSQAVFTGQVTEIAKNEATRFGGLEVTLRVKEVWKGALTEEVKVHTAASTAACGYTFVKDKTYLVYAVSDEADPMRVSLCSRTALIEDAKEDLDFLGKPAFGFDDPDRRRKSSHSETDTNDNCSASVGGTASTGSGLLVLLLVGAVIAIRRRL